MLSLINGQARASSHFDGLDGRMLVEDLVEQRSVYLQHRQKYIPITDQGAFEISSRNATLS